MKQNQTKPKNSSAVRTWLRSGYGNWIRRLVLWGGFAFFIRYAYFEEFYQAESFVLNWLSICLTIQTIALYYVFSNYIFPHTIYKQKFSYFLICLLVSHLIIYELNYMLFWILHRISDGPRVGRDWALFQRSGVFGFITDASVSFYSFLWSFPFAIMILIVRAFRDILTLRLRNLQLEKDKINLELDFLKAQVNPHFLFNTLNSVYARVFDSDEQAADLVLRLSELMRYNLYEADVVKIALDKELSYVQNYLDLERNRLSDQFVTIDYEQTGNPATYQITPLLLIAFVENAFKHGVKGATEPAYVQVSATVTEDQLVFRVENSMPSKQGTLINQRLPHLAVKAGGIGLSNVNRRLEALYKGHYELVVTPNSDTYVVVLTMWLETVSTMTSVKV